MTEMVAALRGLVKNGGRAICEFDGNAPAVVVLDAAAYGVDFASTSKTGSTVALSAAAATTEQQFEHLRATFQLVHRRKPADVIHQVKLSLERLGCSVDICSLVACRDAKLNAHVVLLTDFEDSALLSTLTETDLTAIQSITNSASTLL